MKLEIKLKSNLSESEVVVIKEVIKLLEGVEEVYIKKNK